MIVSGNSMLPNFHDKEQLVAEKISLNFRPIQRGDIVIFEHPEYPKKLVIKRVVGMPKETIIISQGKVLLDGKPLEEPYVHEQNQTRGKRVIKEDTTYQIPENSYVLLGDNRSNSIDSREWGAVPAENIIGRAFMVYYPLTNFRLVKNGGLL